MTGYRDFPEQLELTDGELFLLSDALPASDAASFVNHLRTNIDWQHEVYRGTRTRRGTAWFADDGVEYRYSNQIWTTTDWDTQVEHVRNTVQDLTGCQFNSVLLNHYPDGRARMGWHSDDEPELGQNPTIASLSFGVARAFKLKHKQTDERHEVMLEDNSLLIMAGSLQHHWFHTIPRRSENLGERFNLTFRYTIPGYWSERS